MSDAIHEAKVLAQSAGVRRLDDEVFRISGEDARSWLGGQISNDIRGMERGDAVYTLVLDVRGKILADGWVLERGDDLVMVVPHGTRAILEAHFDKYIVMEDVELDALDDVVVTVQGPRASEVAERASAPSFPCDRLGLGGRDLLVPSADADALERDRTGAAEAIGGGRVGEAGWELARLRAGRPRFGVDFGPANYPQEVGLEQLAVSFDKGCYLGQEVVCTLQNRGQLSRRLVALTAGDLQAELELRQGEKRVGQIRISRERSRSGGRPRVWLCEAARRDAGGDPRQRPRRRASHPDPRREAPFRVDSGSPMIRRASQKRTEIMLSLTDKAADKVKEIRDAEGLGAQGLRVRVIGGGCSGFTYDLFFEDETTEFDQTFESEGVPLYIDMMSLQYLEGTQIDYVEGLHGAGFKFVNPKAKSTCGCGSSFSA